MKMGNNNYKVYILIKSVIIIFLCLAFSIKINGITSDIFIIPLNFVINKCNIGNIGSGAYFGYVTSGDVNQIYLVVKNLIETGNILTNSRLGAPFISELHDFPMVLTFNFEILVLRLIYAVYPNIFVALNIYYVILPAVFGIIAFFSLRSLDTPDWINMGAAIVYAFLPFYFMRGMEHFALTAYQFVPLAFLMCVWGYQHKIFESFSKKQIFGNYRNWLTVFFCLLIVNNGNGYWQPFSCFFLLLTGIIIFLDTKMWKRALACLIPMGFIIVFFMISIYPFFHYQAEYGRNTIVGKRPMIDSELYGLKISQMLMPYEIPGNTNLEQRFKDYYKTVPLTNENVSSNLGLIGSTGFLVLLFNLLLRKNDSYCLLSLFSRLNVCAVLFATIGGFSAITFVFIGSGVMLRGFNRISVYIAFLAIAAMCLCAQKLLENLDGRGYTICRICICLLFVIHFVFIYSWFHKKPDYAALNEQYQSDKQFVADIETSLPEGVMIYQLPYHKFPEAGPVNEMKDYDLFTGFLHSKKLRWSYGAMKGRKGDQWHEWIASFPMNKRIKMLSLVGFQGIYIERRAYKQKELEELEAELVSLLNVNPIESKDKHLVFYSMKSFNDSYLSRYTHEEIYKLHNDLLSRGIMINVKGVSHIEKDSHGNTWRWMDKNDKIDFEYHGKPYDKEIKLSISAGASSEANLKVDINGNLFTYKIFNKPTSIVIPAHFRQGKNTIELCTDADKVNAPKDKRSMYMRLFNCDINEDTLLPSLVIK